jgi:rubrerythrin
MVVIPTLTLWTPKPWLESKALTLEKDSPFSFPLTKEIHMATISQETFFRPIEVNRKAWTIPAEAYNRVRALLTQSKEKNVFVPIRTMQFLAVLDKNEIVFIDADGGYRYQDNEGGRIIQLAWQHFGPHVRESLLEPVPCEIVYYSKNAEQTMKRLYREFLDALIQMEQRHVQSVPPNKTARILTIRAGD